jgi:hypothetical protein
MRLNRCFVLAIAVSFVLSGALCSAICLAGSADPTPTHPESAAPHSEHASHHEHGGEPNDVPGRSDHGTDCTSCSVEAPIAYAAQKAPNPSSLVIVTLCPGIAPMARGTFPAPCEPNAEPPPRSLFLLKSSFLL